MVTCDNCDCSAEPCTGVCTESDGRLCDECADSIDWADRVTVSCQGCSSFVPQSEATFIQYEGYVCPECMKTDTWKRRKENGSNRGAHPLRSGSRAVETFD